MREVLGLVGGSVMTVSAAYYLADILRGHTRPQRASWLVWAVIGLAGFGTADAGGAGPGAYAAAVDAFACAGTFLLSVLPRYGKPGGRRYDPLLVAGALTGVVLWRFGALSVTAASVGIVVIDCVALWPTLREAWSQPGLECAASWAADLAGSATCAAATSTVSVAALAYPLYLVAASAAVLVILVVRRRTAVVRPVRARVTFGQRCSRVGVAP